MLDKYFKNKWTLEWKDEISLPKRLLIMSILLSGIVVNLDVVMAQRKMSLNELSEKVGVSLSNLSILKTGKARAIRFSTLESLCESLDCQPGDLLEFNNEKK